MTTQARFWSKVQKGGACWLWTGRLYSGYGRFRLNGGRSTGAHRASFVIANGEIPDGLFVLHRCDNPACVNPAHLFLGTQRDNVVDMHAKGRARKTRTKQAKLTDEQVRSIRSALVEGTCQRRLAEQYGVSPSAIHLVNKRRTYAHV